MLKAASWTQNWMEDQGLAVLLLHLERTDLAVINFPSISHFYFLKLSHYFPSSFMFLSSHLPYPLEVTTWIRFDPHSSI